MLELIHSIFHAFIRHIKYLKDQETHFGFMDVILFRSGHQHV